MVSLQSVVLGEDIEGIHKFSEPPTEDIVKVVDSNHDPTEKRPSIGDLELNNKIQIVLGGRACAELDCGGTTILSVSLGRQQLDRLMTGSSVISVKASYCAHHCAAVAACDKKEEDKEEDDRNQPERVQWGNEVEFLMCCIATTVGLGNVWRFPFVAYENGGGHFLFPYIIAVFIIGYPLYYLESAIGQFATKDSIKVWAVVPALKGVGYAQALGCGFILSYYVPIISLSILYLIMSFQAPVPWAVCAEDWLNCVPSVIPEGEQRPQVVNASSSSELYFVNTILQQKDGIEGGLGAPIWYLTVSLFVSWVIIFLIVSRGVKFYGKASYFLALFPYFVMIILLIFSLTLEGSVDGILFFLTPHWSALLDVKIWYTAVTQVIFSLSVSMGPIILFSSYNNNFRHNIYRDSIIVTTVDTLTSLLSGITIFGILGNMAFELDTEVDSVLGSGGSGLAFVSYTDAIAKTPLPQLFAVLFFVMMSVLGVGSAVGLLIAVNTVMQNAFPRVKTVSMSVLCCGAGFLVGLVYCTPGGQYVLELVDRYGGTFLILFLAIVEVIGIFWIYGLETFCLDIEYMLGIKTFMYWRICWGLIMPQISIIMFLAGLVLAMFQTFGDGYSYPIAGYATGYIMLFLGISVVPIFMFITCRKNRTGNCSESIKKSFSPKESWGPRAVKQRNEWREFKRQAEEHQQSFNATGIKHQIFILFGCYRKNV